MKKTAFLLTVCMILSLLVCPAAAAETQEWEVTWLAPELRAFGHMSEGRLEVYDYEKNRLGYVDQTGQVVIPVAFLSGNVVSSFSGGLVGVGEKDPATGKVKFGFIDRQGETVIPFIYDNVMDFSEGLACVGTFDGERQKWNYRYIDKTGAEVIGPSEAYDITYGFKEGMALVRLGGIFDEVDLWGYIDKTGRLVVPCVLDDAENFSQGLASVGQYDEDGAWKVGYLDLEGNWVLSTYYAELGDFSEGLAVVQGYAAPGVSTCYYVDKQGKVALVPDCDRAREFHEGRALVTKWDESGEEGASKMGFINRAGDTVIPCVYDDAQSFSEGLAAVCRREGETGRWGFVDRNGREVVPLSFDSVGSFSEGVAVVERDGRFGLLTLRRTAYARTQSVEVDGKAVTFEMYALQDGQGGETNYVKVRDVAQVLNGTRAQFEVNWSGGVELTPGQSYTTNGSEMTTPYDGDRTYRSSAALTTVHGAIADLDAIVLTDDQGGGYTYYKLRDLGKALGFQVGWTAERGVYLETDRAYQE